METVIKELNGKQFKCTSDETYKIKKVGTNEIYDEAWDKLDSNFSYELTSKERRKRKEPEEIANQQEPTEIEL